VRLLIKSVVIGVGGTLVYYGMVYLTTLGMPGADWTAHRVRYDAFQFLGEALVVPLIPGALPGLLVAAVLARLGIIGGGFHDGGWFIASVISAPLVHAGIANCWLKRRAARAEATPTFR
jgi:hypothetical protein